MAAVAPPAELLAVRGRRQTLAHLRPRCSDRLTQCRWVCLRPLYRLRRHCRHRRHPPRPLTWSVLPLPSPRNRAQLPPRREAAAVAARCWAAQPSRRLSSRRARQSAAASTALAPPNRQTHPHRQPNPSRLRRSLPHDRRRHPRRYPSHPPPRSRYSASCALMKSVRV